MDTPRIAASDDRRDVRGRAGGAAQLAVALSTGWLTTPDKEPLVPQHVRDRLAQLSPRLGLVFHKGLGCFTLQLKWAAGDPRYQDIAEGRMPDVPWDMVPAGMVPRHLGPEDAVQWVERHVRAVAPSHEELRRIVREQQDALDRHNATTQAGLRDAGRTHFDEALTGATGERADRIGLRRTVHATHSTGV